MGGSRFTHSAPTLAVVESRAHFRLFGIPVRIEPLFVIVAFLFAIRLGPLWLIFTFVLLAFVSVLVHEMGHALTYRALGQRSAVVLHGFGGFTVPTGGGRRVLSKGRSIAVSLSGALFQLLFLWLPARYLLNAEWAADFLGATQTAGGTAVDWDPDSNFDFNWYVTLYYAAFINLWWGVFNLLPIRPLDGGHVAEELFGFENACKLGVGAGVVGGLWVLWATEMTLLVAAFLLFFFAWNNYRELKAGERTGMFDVDAPESPGGGRGGGGPGSQRPGRRGGSRSGGRKRRQSSHLQPVPSLGDVSPPSRDPAEVEPIIWNELRAGNKDRAAGLLRQSGASSYSVFLQASVALAQGQTDTATSLFAAAYAKEPDGPPNLVPATLLADAGEAVHLTQVLVSNGPTGVAAAGSLQTHLHYADRFAPAAQVGELVFAAGPASPAQTAFEVACAWSRAGQGDEGLRWVEAAIDAGFKAPGVLDGEPDLLEVRSQPGWPAVRAKLD